jgi:hypothetical protein
MFIRCAINNNVQNYLYKYFERAFLQKSKLLEWKEMSIESPDNELVVKLSQAKDFSDVFELVEEALIKTLNRKRGGIMLGLQDLGAQRNYFIGAYHVVGSNWIVINKTPLRRIRAHSKESDELYNAYLFHVMLHEYIHALGITDERLCRQVTRDVTLQIIQDENHPAVKLAVQGLGALFPFMRYYTPEDYAMLERSPDQRGMPRIEIVRGFDRKNTPYFS